MCGRHSFLILYINYAKEGGSCETAALLSSPLYKEVILIKDLFLFFLISQIIPNYRTQRSSYKWSNDEQPQLRQCFSSLE